MPFAGDFQEASAEEVVRVAEVSVVRVEASVEAAEEVLQKKVEKYIVDIYLNQREIIESLNCLYEKNNGLKTLISKSVEEIHQRRNFGKLIQRRAQNFFWDKFLESKSVRQSVLQANSSVEFFSLRNSIQTVFGEIKLQPNNLDLEVIQLKVRYYSWTFGILCYLLPFGSAAAIFTVLIIFPNTNYLYLGTAVLVPSVLVIFIAWMYIIRFIAFLCEKEISI